MYLRWKCRRLTSGRKSKSAVLVECSRVNGHPRQQIICYVATFQEGKEKDQRTQELFWAKATHQLDIANLEQSTRRQIERTLMASVPKPKRARKRDVNHELAATNIIESSRNDIKQACALYVSRVHEFWEELRKTAKDRYTELQSSIQASEQARTQAVAAGQTISQLLNDDLYAKGAFWNRLAFQDRYAHYLTNAKADVTSKDMARIDMLRRLEILERVYQCRHNILSQAKHFLTLLGKSPEQLLAEDPDVARILLDALSR